MNTRVSFITPREVLVETSVGDDVVLGFSDDLNYQIEQQSVIKFTHNLAVLFDHFYQGDSSVIFGEINRQLAINNYRMIQSCSIFGQRQKVARRAKLGARIKQLRAEQGMDAKTLARLSGIDAANLCRIEAGKYSVGFDILSRVAFMLGKKIEFVDLNEEDYE